MASINLQKIVSVKGQPGLFHLLNDNKKGYFLQSMEGGTTRFFSNEKGKVLAVGNVDLKLKEGSLNVLDIYRAMEKSEIQLEMEADEAYMSDYFFQMIPNLDLSVSMGHLRKVLKWYHLIRNHFDTTQDMVNEEDDGLSIV